MPNIVVPQKSGSRYKLSVLALALASVPAFASDFSATALPDGFSNPYPKSLSGSGAILVGSVTNTANNAGVAVRWTNFGTALEFLGTPSGTIKSSAAGVSADGSAIVGWGTLNGGNRQALLWTSTGVTILPDLAGATNGSTALGISSTGIYVVGYSQVNNEYQAVRWDARDNSTVSLGQLPNSSSSRAKTVSSDGSIVAGDTNTRAFVWHATSQTMTELPMLAGTYTQSRVEGMSADGSIVVGMVNDGPLMQATYWKTGDNTVHGLGTLASDTNSWALGVSADGKVIVGQSNNGATLKAFRWTQTTGMQSVAQWLNDAGVAVPSGWKLTTALSTNQDGSVMAGDGTDNNGKSIAWLSRIGEFGTGLLTDVAAYNATLAETAGKAPQAAAGIAGLALGGAHHRSLRDSGLAVTGNGSCAWATTDMARHNGTDTTMNLVEAGACKDIGATRLGLGVGQAWSRQGWSQGGSAHVNGQYLLAEAAADLGGGIEASLLGYYGRFSTDLKRNYQNGAATDTSRGAPDATSTALRLRADWKEAFALASARFSPYAAYTWTDSRIDGYTETGGAFPARFDATTQRSQDIRLGLAASTPLAASTDLRVAVEAARRLDETSSGTSGQVLGLWSFSSTGQKTTQNWSRLLVDLDHRLGKASLINASLSAASSGGDASWGASLGYRANF